jgi:hypothetical protein
MVEKDDSHMAVERRELVVLAPIRSLYGFQVDENKSLLETGDRFENLQQRNLPESFR